VEVIHQEMLHYQLDHHLHLVVAHLNQILVEQKQVVAQNLKQ